ncbi:MAG: transposase [Armatimonadota bacterium]
MQRTIGRPRGRPRRTDRTVVPAADPPPIDRDAALAAFLDEGYSFRLLVGMRWPGGVHCPHCGEADPGYLETRQIWKCRRPTCRRQFSVRVNTLFEDSPIALGQWLSALWLVANHPGGISSYGLREALGVTQKTGWLMLRRIRLASERASVVCRDGADARERFLSITSGVLSVPRTLLSETSPETIERARMPFHGSNIGGSGVLAGT